MVHSGASASVPTVRPSGPASLVQRLEEARVDHLRLASWNKGKERHSRVAFHHDTASALRDAIAILKASGPAAHAEAGG